VVGSTAVNGVAELHSKLLASTTLRDFAELWPGKFRNVTNGVSPRRFMRMANPRLSNVITAHLGDEGWLLELDRLHRLEELADDHALQEQWRAVKRLNKHDLAAHTAQATGVVIDPEAMCDVMVKRFHEYKRQLLKVLHVITLFHRIRNNPGADYVPRTVIFGGKAAPGYYLAKLIIRLINGVADVVNNDPKVNDRLRVVFIPNFNVKHGHYVYPAADLSEQISTAGKEASGTGNMKFAMNGALTIGTLDGANVEIRQEAGAKNFFLFGLTVDQVEELKRNGYRPAEHYAAHAELRTAVDLVRDGAFSNGDRDLFRPLVDNLMSRDEYLVFADYPSYAECQATVDAAWRDRDRWTRMSIVNAARMGKFSSDRAIRDYMREIWKVEPVLVPLDD
jgi:starch phosphorylase